MKTNLLKFCLVVLCAVFGVSAGWAENVVWDWTQNVSTTASTDQVTYVNDLVTMVVNKGSATAAANNYLGSGETRVYKGNEITITPAAGYSISSITFATSSATYSGNWVDATWDNASAEKNADDNKIAVVTPTDGKQTVSATIGTATRAKTVTISLSKSDGGSTPEPVKYTVTVADNIVNGTVTSNPTSAAAGAVVTLTATPADGYKLGAWIVTNESSHDLITVTNNKFTMPAANVNVSATFIENIDYAVLPFNWEGGIQSDFLALNGVTADGLGTDYAVGNAPYRIKLDGTDDWFQIKTKEAIGLCTIGVKMIGGGTSSSITVKESANGTDFTDVETLSISGEQNDVLNLATTKNLKAESRYVRFVFTKGSNVGVGAISIAKPVAATAEHTLTLVAQDSKGDYYATFSADKDVIFLASQLAEVQTVFTDGDELLLESLSAESWAMVEGVESTESYGYYVPANTGVVICSGNATVKYYDVTSYEYNQNDSDFSDNMLVAASVAMTGANKFYKLAYDNYDAKSGLGFYWGAENGGAFTCKAGTAYLAVPSGVASNVRGFSFDGGVVTSIKSVENKTGNVIYDLSGRRVNRLQQGVNIVNGKMVIR